MGSLAPTAGMTKQTRTALIVVVIGAIAAAVFFLLRGDTVFRMKVGGFFTSKPSASKATSSVAASPINAPTSFRSIVREIQSSSDIQATYDKYRSHPDPTGEIAFRLYLAIDDCIHFAHKSVEQISKEMNAVGAAAAHNAPRQKLIESRIQRCKGFKNWGSDNVLITATGLRDRSIGLGYAGAAASMLTVRLINEPAGRLDAEAIQLLSANIDGDVIKGVFNYLSHRNGEAWRSQFGDPAVMIAAWTLLQCNYGTACDESSPAVVMSCIYYATCDRHDVESALPSLYPSLTQERLQEAARLVPILAAQIQSRDWVRLGFSPQQGSNPVETTKAPQSRGFVSALFVAQCVAPSQVSAGPERNSRAYG